MTKVLKTEEVKGFSNRVSRWRNNADMNLSDCAAHFGISRSYLYRIESVEDATISAEVYQRIINLIDPRER